MGEFNKETIKLFKALNKKVDAVLTLVKILQVKVEVLEKRKYTSYRGLPR